MAVLLLAALLPLPGRTTSPTPFVMGIDHPDTTLGGKWLRRIHAEAFRRLGIPVTFVVYPTMRLSVMLERGDVDGEAQRARVYGAAHPELVRVEEPVTDGQFAFFVANTTVRLSRLEELPASNLRAQYRRGVMVCENALKAWQPADRMFDVTSTEQGLRNLLDGPPEFFHCDTELSVASTLYTEPFKGVTTIRKLLVIDESPLYPYLHRRYAALAPRLAGVLRQMKAEGLILRYRREVERELRRR
jgi:polar amino acid transport system substrate-binding protein